MRYDRYRHCDRRPGRNVELTLLVIFSVKGWSEGRQIMVGRGGIRLRFGGEYSGWFDVGGVHDYGVGVMLCLLMMCGKIVRRRHVM